MVKSALSRARKKMKSVWIMPDTHALVRNFADQNDLYIEEATEHLVAVGLKMETMKRMAEKQSEEQAST